MAEDWRLTVGLPGASHSNELLRALHGHEVEDEVRARYGDRVAVSASGEHVFLYADSASAAREAQQVVEDLLTAQDVKGEFKLERWHHLEERWEDANVPLPTSASEQRAEHERLEQTETAESQASGLASWEVRIELASHRDAHALAQRLKNEGHDRIVRRWRFLLIGTADEDDARTLAEQLTNELPHGATIHVEPAGGMAWQLTPNNPFAVFGGLAS